MKDTQTNWQRHIKAQTKSGFTVQAYCDEHNLTIGMFYYWKRKLSISKASLSFHEVDVLPVGHHPPVIEIYLGSEKVIRIEGEVSASFVRQLIPW